MDCCDDSQYDRPAVFHGVIIAGERRVHHPERCRRERAMPGRRAGE